MGRRRGRENEGYTFPRSDAEFETLTEGSEGLVPHVQARMRAASDSLGGP